jgi:hypothetical protein
LKNDGPFALYKGLSSGLVGTVLSYGIYFWWYRFLKNFFYNVLKRKELSDFDVSLITLISGVINSFLTNPIWFINTRMAISKDKKNII